MAFPPPRIRRLLPLMLLVLFLAPQGSILLATAVTYTHQFQKNTYQNDKEMIRFPGTKILHTPIVVLAPQDSIFLATAVTHNSSVPKKIFLKMIKK